MVDFRKRLAGRQAKRLTDPVALYDTLDRAHDKGPLRPAQLVVLKKWSMTDDGARDLVVKLHTGQGKTLIGLLILQSRLNAGGGPVVYLCPNKFLIAQAREQAKQFGIRTCEAGSELPDEFLDGTTILVTSVQKLFNGLTKFGLGTQSVRVDTVLMDDAHACADIIREQCRIRIPADAPAYQALRVLFANDLEGQGVGTWADISNGRRDAVLPVPYWAWLPRESEVANVLSKNQHYEYIRFAWPLLKDILGHCQCVVSGAAVEIEPYVAPLDAFGSYWNARYRVFMSATVTNDAFLIKGLQLAPETIVAPLGYEEETWAGERMLLLPSLIHGDLNRERIVTELGKPNSKRRSGVVALVPSTARTQDWGKYGATVADKDNVLAVIGELKKGMLENTVVLVNRYDGIDLPDDTCRILVFDGRPYSENLSDLWQELCRPNSEATLMRTVRSIEQGMGRSVRGEKDYCVVIAVGTDLVRILRDPATRRYFSPQMVAQIDLGFEIAAMVKQDIEAGEDPFAGLKGLLSQCLRRDADWKVFYVEQMNEITLASPDNAVLRVYGAELEAERAFHAGDCSAAAEVIQRLLDGSSMGSDDRGWYLQEMARYSWKIDRAESDRLQRAAHKHNRKLLKPRSGVAVARLTVSQGRIERIVEWVKERGDYGGLNASVTDVLNDLAFGVKADKFEKALDELSRAIGFVGERPDKEWKEGPDNLWALDDSHYVLWECKSEVNVTRAEIDRREAEQMNRSSAWFEKYYQGMKVKRFIVHPSHVVQRAAAFTHEVQTVRVVELQRLTGAVKGFFEAFETMDFQSLSPTHVQKLIEEHGLDLSSLLSKYSKKIRSLGDRRGK